MLCQNCGKNEANVRYTQIVNGVKKEMILCEECAEKMGIKNFKINMPIHFSNFLETGLLGCAECYDMFEDRLDSVLKNIQGNVKHVGRKPLNISEKMQNTGENNTKKMNREEKKVENNELEQLKKDLNKAIEEERYEDAATIRDKIKQINDKK